MWNLSCIFGDWALSPLRCIKSRRHARDRSSKLGDLQAEAARSPSRPVHPQTESRLCRLPVELLHLINDELPTHSRASLALACTLLAYKQGTLSWSALKYQPVDKQIFLDELSRDHPCLLPCHTCLRLHNRERVKRSPDLHVEAGGLKVFRSVLRCRMSFAYIQLAMSCHRVSPDYDLLSQAKDSGTIELSASQISPIELTVDFKIVNDRFLYKACTRREIDIQKVTRDRAPLKASTTYTEFQQLIPKYDDPLSYLEPRHILFAKFDALYLGYRDQLSQQGSLLKCGHLDISAGFPILTWTLFKQAETLIHAGLKSATTIQSDIHRCRYCATEIQATVELSPDATCWFAATSWKDLGDGTDQTKQPWITHQQFDPSRVWYRGFYQPTHKHRGCISEALETPTLADTTLHLAVPPFGLFDGEFKFERLYNEDDDLDDLTVNETRNPSDAAEHAM